jgi:HAD superfamily hydrolase (TIGR01490 family)
VTHDRSSRPGQAAFFDVDGTILRGVTLFDFLRFQLDGEGGPGSYQRATRELFEAKRRGADRFVTNRMYFGLLRGRSWDSLVAAGAQWFSIAAEDPDFFRPVVLERLRRHQRDGVEVVLVSAAFEPCLRPLAEHLGVVHLLCSRPEIRSGLLTGEVEPFLGPAKSRAVLALAQRWGFDLTASFAYGDHSTDVEFMELVGHPVAVAPSNELAAIAADRCWPVLAGSDPGRG